MADSIKSTLFLKPTQLILTMPDGERQVIPLLAEVVRIGRGTLVASDLITRIQPLPGGLHLVTLSTGDELQVSRIQSRLLRERFLKL